MTDSSWTLDPVINASMETLKLPPEEDLKALMAKRAPMEARAPKVGEQAPAFTAERLSAEGKVTGEQVSLADYRGRDFALMFGSITCPIYRGQIQRFNEIYAELNERYAFLLIYISEAHPEDGWQLDINHDQSVVYNQPVTKAERIAIAQDGVCQHAIKLPLAVDDMDNTIDQLYSGSPERLYLIDAEGAVRHRSVPGPFKLDVIENWYQALKG
ncbi:MAG: redoxin domain-containing protein [Gammaproteobacteria bacterium]|jgi:hypothetical protein|nr:redoxin domain-containing protein [Gammaproteobacteria bacterium]MDP7296869.1 redoxin domain-containing protein [Gammaproteobacteria bacterium]MDP7419314.1 redoxin domain-containing protein [Gammaproteobacteria bacterium]HJP38352.1 deiodinase-like protein [Gammaproteobacteria bacterium]